MFNLLEIRAEVQLRSETASRVGFSRVGVNIPGRRTASHREFVDVHIPTNHRFLKSA